MGLLDPKPPMNLWPNGRFTVTIKSVQERKTVGGNQYYLVWTTTENFPPIILSAIERMAFWGYTGRAQTDLPPDNLWMVGRDLLVEVEERRLHGRPYSHVIPIKPVD